MTITRQKLRDNVAIIMGTGSGMGAVVAKLFAAEEAKVFGADLNIERLQEVISEINASEEKSAAIKTDGQIWMKHGNV